MKYQIIIPDDISPYPDKYEIRTATLLAKYFKTNIYFIPRSKERTPDIRIKNTKWEIKNPEGKSKTTISNQFRRAKKQSENICIDLHHIKLNESKAISYSKAQFFEQKKFKSLIIITKSSKILAFSQHA